ncbi:MAG: 50S ribosomal protein L3 [Ignavibacteriales bacterium]|nr:50S ribosomal protein L3 [Ignavibacteriales bacterium]
MMPGLLSKKLGMTNIFSADGQMVTVTVLEAGPCQVVGIKTKEKDGYEALQLGFGTKKEKLVSKPVMGQYKKNNLTPSSVIKEFDNFSISEYKVGDSLTVELFNEGEKVKLTGISKGKGFQGVMKRHGFQGAQRTHGQHDRERAPGSIGSSSYPSRVFKGMKMAGRMGNNRVTILNLRVIKIIPEKNIIMVNGAVPGAINSIVEIKK